MNLHCTGQLIASCNICHTHNNIACNDLPFDIVEVKEGRMGTERCHSVEHAIKCISCRREIAIKYEVWEYPDGSINDEDVEVTGGSLVQGCSFEMTE